MPIINFSSFAESRNSAAASTDHGHLIANIDLNDENRWVPYADGVWVQPCSFNLSSGRFRLILKALPCSLPQDRPRLKRDRGISALTVFKNGGSMTIAKPAKLAHVVYRTRRFSEMIEWYKTVFGAKVQYENPGFAFLTFDDEHHRF